MANSMYGKAKQALLEGTANLVAGNVKVVIVDTVGGATNYTFNGVHQFLSDVPVGARRATSPALTGKTFTNGTFDANDIVGAFPSLSGAAIEAAILYVDTGVEATSPLLVFYDTGASLPFTPNGNNADLILNAAGLFSL